MPSKKRIIKIEHSIDLEMQHANCKIQIGSFFREVVLSKLTAKHSTKDNMGLQRVSIGVILVLAAVLLTWTTVEFVQPLIQKAHPCPVQESERRQESDGKQPVSGKRPTNGNERVCKMITGSRQKNR
jgi:hypothetical protein